jgi:hypothetical protein
MFGRRFNYTNRSSGHPTRGVSSQVIARAIDSTSQRIRLRQMGTVPSAAARSVEIAPCVMRATNSHPRLLLSSSPVCCASCRSLAAGSHARSCRLLQDGLLKALRVARPAEERAALHTRRKEPFGVLIVPYRQTTHGVCRRSNEGDEASKHKCRLRIVAEPEQCDGHKSNTEKCSLNNHIYHFPVSIQNQSCLLVRSRGVVGNGCADFFCERRAKAKRTHRSRYCNFQGNTSHGYAVSLSQSLRVIS